MDKKLFSEMEKRMDKVLAILKSDYATLRTGRASTALLDKIYVDYYVHDPDKSSCLTSIPEPKMILIQPWEVKMLQTIEKAILKSELGITPNNDGKVIRLILPELTAERRQELAKFAKKKCEEAKVAIRNIRREYNDALKKMEKNKEISEDELKRSQEEIQKITDKFIDEADKILANKEKEIMEV